MAELRHYQALLEKTAGASSPSPSGHDQPNIAQAEFESNNRDNRDTLKSLFDRAQMVEKDQTKDIKHLFDRKDATDVIPGNPLMKVASAVIAQVPEQNSHLRSSSPAFKQVMQQAFNDEVEKIAASLSGVGNFMDSARRAAQYLEPHARRAGSAIKGTIKKHPFASTATGFVAGAALGHRHGRNEEREAQQSYSRY